MDKKLPRHRTSSPRSSNELNDSFLEDLELIPGDSNKAYSAHHADRNITRRTISPPNTCLISDSDEFELFLQQQNRASSSAITPSTSESKTIIANKPASAESKSSDKTRHAGMTTTKELRLKLQDNKIKPQETKVKLKSQDMKTKLQENKSVAKDRSRRSDNFKENSRCSDASSKENSRPSDSSKDSVCQHEVTKERSRHSDVSKKSDSKEISESVVLLNAIKDIISSYTRQESAKILRLVQDLHINSQANLIKSLIFQTDDLKRELNPAKDSSRVGMLMEENEKLREGFALLKLKNEELQKRVEEVDHIKEENVMLKQKCKELSMQKL